MTLYRFLASIKFLSKSYAVKFLFVAFIGIHVPLIGLIFYTGFSHTNSLNPTELLITTLLLTLAATALTLYLLNKLLQPVAVAKAALNEYIEHHTIPDLPGHYKDEMGVLLSSIQHTITSLEEANKTKMDLIHTITHDLRSPLNQIISLTDLVEQADEQEQRDFVRLIKKCAEQELDFIANYIAMIETNDFSAKEESWQQVNLLQLTEHLLSKLAISLSSKKLTVRTIIDSSILVSTPSKALFEHILQNLLTNAIKFSYPNGTITLHAKTESTSVIFSISDEGIGFDPSKAKDLFLKFTPHRRQGTQMEGTNGIGLYLTSEIVKHHKGRIWATSPGAEKGATFTVELPTQI